MSAGRESNKRKSNNCMVRNIIMTPQNLTGTVMGVELVGGRKAVMTGTKGEVTGTE